MNRHHLEMLASPRRAAMLEEHVLPWIATVGDLGDDVLEIGPGPGLTTDLLRVRTARLTAVESDDALASALADRLAGTNVTVVHGNAARTAFAADRFSAAACFAVLHHIESVREQDEVFAELARVLRPGALLVGSDGYDNEGTRQAHVGDTFVPIDPGELSDRLAAAGFTGTAIERDEYEFRFSAFKGA